MVYFFNWLFLFVSCDTNIIYFNLIIKNKFFNDFKITGKSGDSILTYYKWSINLGNTQKLQVIKITKMFY